MDPRRLLLVLDLDETLFHATENPLRQTESFRIGPYYVYLRPHVRSFLDFALAKFNVAVWTASTTDYAQSAIEALFESPDALAFLWSRSRCTMRMDPETRDYYWVKDLKKVRRLGFSLAHVLVVDDTARKHERNYSNLVPIAPFEGEENDTELLHLTAYLETLVSVENVRPIEKRWWRRQFPKR